MDFTTTPQSFTTHIVLSSLPLSQHTEYAVKAEEKFYNDYKKEERSYYINPDKYDDANLYRPLKYYVFGNYDIAFISMSDSFKFAQKLFLPSEDPAVETGFHPNSFQVITGICAGHSMEQKGSCLSIFFQDLLDPNQSRFRHLFFGLVNLKINNGLLLGNGNTLLSPLIQLLKNKLSKIPGLDFVVLQSLSWYEINLVLFCDKMTIIAEVLRDVRALNLSNLPVETGDLVFEQSLYYTGLSKNVETDKEKIHLLSDTQTYLGLRWDEMHNPSENSLEEMLAYIHQMNIQVETEWQVRPGHFAHFLQKIQAQWKFPETDGTNQTDATNAFVLAGKSDYLFPRVRTTLENNIRLIRVVMNADNKFFKDIRRFKTRILLGAQPKKRIDLSNKPSYQSHLKKLTLTAEEIKATNQLLKENKISRQFRNKIRKILFNYNAGIGDHVLMPFFLDFHGFIMNLRREISLAARMTKGTSVAYVERNFMRYIRVFEEGHKTRALNSYQFEEINDIDLDFNTSIQQLLSIYSNLIRTLSPLFYPDNVYNPVVTLSVNNTVANAIAINYNIYHLLSPEFIFATLVKEMLNKYRVILESNAGLKGAQEQYVRADRGIRQLQQNFEKEIQEDQFLVLLKENGSLDFNNLLIDAVRCIFHYQGNFKLFQYWLWAYNFQNPSLYNTRGSFSEKYMMTEMIRLIFTSMLLGHQVAMEDCPLPEVRNHWNRYFSKLQKSLAGLFEKKDLINEFRSVVAILLRDALTQQLSQAGGQSYTVTDQLTKKINNILRFPGQSSVEFSNLYDIILKREAYFLQFEGGFRDSIRDGQPIFYDTQRHQSQQCFTAAVMHFYLLSIAEMNSYQIKLFRRSWRSGQPDKLFAEHEDSRLYSLDPMGGVFFTRPEKLNDYFRMRNAILQSLWHLAFFQKGQYLHSLPLR